MAAQELNNSCEGRNLKVNGNGFSVCLYHDKQKNGVLYIGLTDKIEERVKEHKLKVYPKSFTAKYNCERLVYFEEFKNGNEVEKREKQFKK